MKIKEAPKSKSQVFIVAIIALLAIAFMAIIMSNESLFDKKSQHFVPDSNIAGAATYSCSTYLYYCNKGYASYCNYYYTYCVDPTPRISYWWGKVNQHTENGVWKTDPDGRSGANLDMLTYCNKWYPGTTSVVPYKTETITFYAAGNTGSYVSTRQSYACVKKTSPTCEYDFLGITMDNKYYPYGTQCLCYVDYDDDRYNININRVSTTFMPGIEPSFSAWTDEVKKECKAICDNPKNCLTATSTCSDSDGGKNYYKEGYITINGKFVEGDYCLTNSVVEYNLVEGCRYDRIIYNCPNGCNNGACI